MDSARILNKILKELDSLSQEKAKDFYYVIDGYSDEYDEDGLRRLVFNWELLENKRFKDYYPKTANVIGLLKANNDGIERDGVVYEQIISLATEAKKEIVSEEMRNGRKI